MTQFYQAFPRVSTASDKRWDEKAWVWGYLGWILSCVARPHSALREKVWDMAIELLVTKEFN